MSIVPPTTEENCPSHSSSAAAAAAATSAPVTLKWSDFTNQFRNSTPSDIGLASFVVLYAWFSMSTMLFGMNFMLDSFKDSRAASYTTLLSTALMFLVEAFVFCGGMFLACTTVERFSAGKAAFRDVWQWRHLGQLAVLGTVDALGGITGTYAAPNTPIAVQFTILATSVVWTFIFAKWLVPDRDRPCTPLVALAVFLTIVGAAVTIVPQWDSMEQLRGFWSSVGWIIIFTLATVFPLILNVLYSRYLVEHVDQNGRSVIIVGAIPPGSDDDDDDDGDNTAVSSAQLATAVPVILNNPSDVTSLGCEAANSSSSSNQSLQPLPAVVSSRHQDSAGNSNSSSGKATKSNWPYFLAKISIAFLGDALIQLAVILLLLPLDFCPWFGPASSADEAMKWIDSGFAEIFEARYNARTGWYFLLYVYGFFASHLMGASMSYYSPQLTAFIYSLNVPMNLILLVIFPSWNVFSQHAPVWASATSIVVTAVGAILYASWEHAQRLRDSLTAMRPLPSADLTAEGNG